MGKIEIMFGALAAGQALLHFRLSRAKPAQPSVLPPAPLSSAPPLSHPAAQAQAHAAPAHHADSTTRKEGEVIWR